VKLTLVLLVVTLLHANSCIELSSDRVVAGQLVEAVPALRQLAPDTPLGFAPLPGLVRVIDRREFGAIASHEGVTLTDVPDVCIERALRSISPSEMLAALQAALEIPQAELIVEEYSNQPLPPGRLEFQRSTLNQPPATAPSSSVYWRGRLMYGEHRGVPVWARVRILVDRTVYSATRDIAAGAPIQEADVQPTTVREFPFTQAKPESAAEMMGKVSRHPIRAGQRIAASTLDTPKEVTRGDIVQVRVIDGRTTLSFDGIAMSSGRKGESILVHNAASGRNFRAVVEEKGRATVRPTVGD